jgi:hypothetical protein
MKHSYPLFEDEISSGISLENRFISHKKCAHNLQHWYFNWEVKRRNACNCPVWPSVASVELSSMITRLSFAMCQESYSVTAKVFVEINSYLKFCNDLLCRFRDASLNRLNEKVKYFLVVHHFNNFAIDFAKHEVPFLVFERVVQTAFGHCFQTVDKGLNFIFVCRWSLHHNFACQGVKQVAILFSVGPRTLNKIGSFKVLAHNARVYSSESFEML